MTRFRPELSWRLENVSRELSNLIIKYRPQALDGLDVGASTGELMMSISRRTGMNFVGIDPDVERIRSSIRGAKVLLGRADSIPFPDESFDVVTLCSVYEHLPPAARVPSLKQVFRVLRPKGILVCQIPDMYLPIELHSWLPLQQFLPRQIGEIYARRFAFTPWPHEVGMDWFRIGPTDVIGDALKANFRLLESATLRYSVFSVPRHVVLFALVSNIIPVGFRLCFVKSDSSNHGSGCAVGYGP